MNGQPLHRLRAVRRREGLRLRTVARRLGVPATCAASQELLADPPLSVVLAWQRALRVPLVELVGDPEEPMSSPLRDRGRLVRIMRTAASIAAVARQPRVKRLAEMLRTQLVELMPELDDVSPWPSVGQARSVKEHGQRWFRSLPDELFAEQIETREF